MRIDMIVIDSFRGATNPIEVCFDERPITLIFGENGTGKSTIIDAIDFVCNQRLGSLENMSIGSKARSFIPSIGSTADRVYVELHSGSNDWKARLSGKEITVGSSGPPLNASIIRRAEITKLITAQPGKRYEELQKFVAVPRTDNNEAALKKALEQKKQEMDNCARLAEQAERLLRQSYLVESNLDGNYITWAETETKKDVTDLEHKVKQLGSVISLYEKFSQAIESYGEYKTDKNEKEYVLQKARDNLSSVLEKAASQSVELLDVLRAAEGYIDRKPNVTTCPVCEQSVVAADLKKRISRRVEDMKELNQVVKSEKTAKDALNKAETLISNQWKLMVQAAIQLVKAINQSSLSIFEPFHGTVKEYEQAVSVEEIDPTFQTKLAALHDGIRKELEIWKDLKNASQKSLDQNKLIKVNLTAYRENISNGMELDKLCGKLREAHEIHMQTRIREIDVILASLSEDIDRLYNMLHPEERLGNISLYLKEKARASLELDASFEHLNNVPPHAYYSESHIDTLGICIFLVLAKHNDSDVVVLDDVLTSVDSQHLNRFIDMLTHVTQYFSQIIVATHYRPWMEKYRKGRGQLSNTSVIELGPWSRSNGIRTKAFTTELELLKRELQKDDFDRQVVASKAGVVLESILDFLTLTYHLKVRRNHRYEYSWGELADSFDRKISAELKTIRMDTDGIRKEALLAPLIIDATKFPFVRNCVGCHNSPLGEEMPDNEVLEYGDAVIKLADALVCPVCSTLPMTSIRGSHWECKCRNGSFAMQPLLAP